MDRNHIFQDSCYLIAKIQLKLQISCRAARASLSAISAAYFRLRLASELRKKIGEKSIPTESTESGEQA